MKMLSSMQVARRAARVWCNLTYRIGYNQSEVDGLCPEVPAPVASSRGWVTPIIAFLACFGIGAVYERFALYADHSASGLYQHTAVVRRAQGMQFIDSADAICDRVYEGPSYKCRAKIKQAVLQDRIIYTLGYSDLLYLISTRGRRVDEVRLKVLYEIYR